MNWRKILTILAVIAVGILIYTLYLYLGPYRGLSQQNKQLRKEIEARMASESKMREELGVAKAELAKKTRLVEDLQAEIPELKETISQTKGERELFQELKQLKDVNQQHEKEAGQLRKTIAALEADKKAFDEEASGFKKELQESRNRLRMLSQEVAAKEKDLEKAEQTHQVQVEQLKKEIDEKTQRLSSLEKETENMKEEYQQKVQVLQEQLAQRDQGVQSLTKEKEQLQQTISVLEADKTTLNQEAAQTKNQLQEASSRLDTLSQEITAKEKELQKVKQSYQALIAQLKEILRTIAE